MRYWTLSLLFLASACGDDAPDQDPLPASARPPIAVVADQMVFVGDEVALSGEASSDPDGDPLQYAWHIRSRPALSRAALDHGDTSTVRFSADRPGIVVVDLTVSDGALEGAATAVIGVLATHDAPMAYAGPDRTVRIDSLVFVNAGQSRDPNQLPLIYDWTVISKPASSQVSLAGGTTVTAHFTPDAAGAYELELVAHNGSRPSVPDRVVITAVEPDVVITGDVPNGVLNPDEGYLFGTVVEGLCGADAIAHWSDPDVAAAGFDCYANESTARIRNDGTLLYTNTFEDKLREFHCDSCPAWAPGMPYPSNVLANDTILATPPCEATAVSGFITGITGDRLHRCGATWYTASGTSVPLTGTPLSYGFANKVLTATAIVDIATGAQVPLTGLPTGATLLTTRVAGPTSFWMARHTAGQTTRWRIDHSGVATLEGTYPAPPANHSPAGSARLDGSGHLFQEGWGPGSFEDMILYRNLNGLSEVVYTEATNPGVKIHISSLVTGP